MLFYKCEKITDTDEHEGAKKLLFELLEEHIPKIGKSAALCHRENGAPYLMLEEKEAEGIFISLSHSHGMCAAVISDTPVGIDVEAVRDMGESASRIEGRFLSKYGLDRCNATDADSTTRFFYKWTYAEASYKALGKSITKAERENRCDVSYFHKEMVDDAAKRTYVLCVLKTK